jgi:hypothetical protein
LGSEEFTNGWGQLSAKGPRALAILELLAWRKRGNPSWILILWRKRPQENDQLLVAKKRHLDCLIGGRSTEP